MTDAEIVKIAEDHGLCTIVEGGNYPNDALWFDGDMIPFARAIIEAVYSQEQLCSQINDGIRCNIRRVGDERICPDCNPRK